MNAQPLWYWMRERQAIYQRRQAGVPWPWTTDPILQEFRFCNVFRELDTVTAWIRTHWREPYAHHPNLWFAMCVARQINWPETLEAIGFPEARDALGMNTWFWMAKQAMLARQAAGHKVYTGAYMLRGDIWKDHSKLNDKPTYTIDTVLKSVWDGRQGFFERLQENPSATTLQSVHSWFTKWPGWGGFLSYEVVTDLRHTRYLSSARDIMTWANAGPGAVRGLNRIHGRPVKQALRQEQANAEMRELLRIATGHDGGPLGFQFPALEMRDIEHSLCEMDKYLRVQEGSGRPRAKYHHDEARWKAEHTNGF